MKWIKYDGRDLKGVGAIQIRHKGEVLGVGVDLESGNFFYFENFIPNLDNTVWIPKQEGEILSVMVEDD